MKIAWLSLVTLFAPATAAAQPVTQPSDITADGQQRIGLGVEVVAPDGDVDASEVREAIATELGIAVTDGTAMAPSLGRLEIAAERRLLRIAYHPAAGTVIERTLQLPVTHEERVQLIAFVATNLVRDQASELLDELRTPAVVIPPIAAPITPPRARVATRYIPATLGFVPPLAVDRAFGERVVVGFGVHALVGVTDGSQIASVSGLVDIQRERSSGVQIAGLAASAGRVDDGVQIAGLAAISRGDVTGAQVGGITTLAAGKLRGVQIAGIASASTEVHGVQIAGIATASKRVDGLQIAGIANATKRVDGLQIAGIANATKRADGMQLAGIANVSGNVDGAQIAGIANVGGDVRGVQIGVVNVAKRMRGVQLGVVNLSGDGDDAVPIGLINYARNGRLAAEGWVDSSRISAAAFRHGTKHVHNIWAVGWSPDYDNTLVGAGLGVSFGIGQGVGVDVDAMHWMTNVWNAELSQISQARASVALQLQGLEVFGGVAANVYVADGMDESASFHPVYERRTTTSDGDAVVAWPSAFAGIRLRAR